MNTYPENNDIEIEVRVVNSSGNVHLKECQALYDVLDENSNVLTSGTVSNVFEILKVVVPKEFNVIERGQAKIVRSVAVRFETPAGDLISTVKEFYLVRSDNPLIVGLNSFVTLEKYKLLESIVPKMDQFSKATPDQVISSLLESCERLKRLKYRIGSSFIDLQELSEEQYGNLDVRFKETLERAQIIEANSILSPTDSIEERRRKGVILETINETKMMFSSATPVQHPISLEALKLLSKYLIRSVSITRV